MEEELRNAEDADRRKKEEERLRALAAAAPQQPALAAEVSPVSEARPGAPDSEAGIYHSETPDPLTLPENSDGRGREPIRLESPAEEIGPRIMPPSTGEQVAAASPNSLTALAQAANGAEPAVADEQKPVATHGPAVQTELFGEDSAAGQSTPDAEQAAHHG
jgi:hypothetical protein